MFAAAVFLLFGCDDRLEQALDFAGDNRSELEKTLEYFSDDREKSDAAKFLIANMPGHRCMGGAYREYYAEADRILTPEAGLSALDSLESISAEFRGGIRYEYVSKVITADYLIRDIEKAFAQWKSGEWARHLTFAEFCEWLLPYTCADSQPLEDWRTVLEPYSKKYIDELHQCADYAGNPRDAICRVNDTLKVTIGKQNWIHSAHGFPIYDPKLFARLPGASCEEYAQVATLVMRSKGIPVGIDFTPQWPDRMRGHYWCVFPTLAGKTSKFNPFEANPDYPHFIHAKYAKVFRRTYAPDREYLRLLRRHDGEIPRMFSDPFFRDVTEEYVRTFDLKIPLLESVRISGKDVYIAVFDNYRWKPVCWGRKKGGNACFRGMGPNVAYLVMGYSDGNLVPVSRPFFLSVTGEVTYFQTSGDKTCSFELWRKYPMFQHVFLIHRQIHGGCIQASGSPDFRDAETVCEFPYWDLTSGLVKVKQSRPYRYWRFFPGEQEASELSELFFYPSEAAEFTVQDVHDSGGQPFSNLFDHDPLTNFNTERIGLCGYVDYGRPVMMDHVSYIRRGDGNAIIPGDSYEIYWWNGKGWEQHSEQVAEDVRLEIKDIPEGALYYVHGTSRGIRNRIFCIDANGEVRWL